MIQRNFDGFMEIEGLVGYIGNIRGYVAKVVT